MKKLFTISIALLLFWGCTSKSDSSKDASQNIVLGKIGLSGAWARPGAEGQNSAAYLTVINGTASTDTLLGASTNVAAEAEVHESYKNEAGQMGMRPAGQLVIESGDKLIIKPGGYHIMLMNLHKDIALGDSLNLSLNFAHAGSKTIRIPVKIQN